MMNAIAATETKRKNGRRTFSVVPWSRPHAPPLFLARMNAMWSFQTLTMPGNPSRCRSAHVLEAMSLARETIATSPRKTSDGLLWGAAAPDGAGGATGASGDGDGASGAGPGAAGRGLSGSIIEARGGTSAAEPRQGQREWGGHHLRD